MLFLRAIKLRSSSGWECSSKVVVITNFLFLEFSTFKATFIRKYSDFTRVDQFCNGDWFFRDVSDRFAIQGHQISLRRPHLQSSPRVAKFQVASGRLRTSEPSKKSKNYRPTRFQLCARNLRLMPRFKVNFYPWRCIWKVYLQCSVTYLTFLPLNDFNKCTPLLRGLCCDEFL